MIDIRGICGRPHGSRNGVLNTDTDHSHYAEAGHYPDQCPPGDERGSATGMNIAERLVSFLLPTNPYARFDRTESPPPGAYYCALGIFNRFWHAFHHERTVSERLLWRRLFVAIKIGKNEYMLLNSFL